jgi:hypothetical protein
MKRGFHQLGDTAREILRHVVEKIAGRHPLRQIMDEIDARQTHNAGFARELCQQLTARAGSVRLSDEPDGLGCFYGTYTAEDGEDLRLDVLPPRPLWSGQFGADAADAENWTVFLNGVGVQRAKTIRALATLANLRPL